MIITYGKLQTMVITSDLKQKMQNISVQYYDALSVDMEKANIIELAWLLVFSRLNGEFGIT